MRQYFWRRWLLVGGLLGLVTGGLAEEKWEKEVRAVERRLERLAPEAGGVVFAGSSSIRLWDLDRSFPGLGAINAGFGGSTLADGERFGDRLVWKWRPRLVVLYAGDNDLANGLTPDRVVQDFLSYASAVHAALPNCRLIFLSIKPSASRWHLWSRAQEANARIRAICEAVGEARLQFVDVATPLLGADGQPDARLFDDDQLHLNAAGYEKWRAVLDPFLAAGR